MNSIIGSVSAFGPVKRWLVRRALRTPYQHLPGYMSRWWLFNAYADSEGKSIKRNRLMRRLPSVRIHHILRADDGRAMHDHPWDARSYILGGCYSETRRRGDDLPNGWLTYVPGDVNVLRAEDFHRIAYVSDGGVWTLFITWPKRKSWGFLTRNGVNVEHKTYLAAGERP